MWTSKRWQAGKDSGHHRAIDNAKRRPLLIMHSGSLNLVHALKSRIFDLLSSLGFKERDLSQWGC